jgi:general secretion pathway protein D
MGNHQLKLTDSTAGAVLPIAPGFSSFFSTPNVGVVLNALSTITDVNVVSSPTIMVLDNKRATLQVGDEVPVATQSAVSVLGAGAPIVNSVSFRNTGIILNITPRINDSGRVLLDIEQEVSDVVATTTSKIDSPTIQQRRIKTTVSVNDGEGIVLGGLIQDKATNTRGQVPLAGEIPVLGNLFKKKDDLINRTELLVAITPRVVKDSRHIRAITEEFRDKINFTTRPQRAAPPDRREQVDRVLR